MASYLHTRSTRNDCFLTREVETRQKPLRWQEQGLSFTVSGYGSRIPTNWQIKVDGRWRRVYCRIYSNSGTLFIGKRYDHTNTVQIGE
jgi:hypothetical protein